MPYKKSYKKRYTKKVYKKKAPARKSDISMVKKQLNVLTKKVMGNTATHHLFEQNLQNLQVVDGPYVFTNLTNWSNKSAVFATSTSDWDNSNKLYHKKMTVTCRLTAGNEYDLIGYRIFLVTLKDEANVPARWNSGTGGLALSNNLDYAITNFGKAMLNPKVFNIHKVKEFYTSNYGAPAGTTGPVGPLIKEWNWTVYPKHEVFNPSGNVRQLVTSQDPSKCYYIIIFNDNVSSDLQAPVFTASVNHTVVVAQ